MKKLFFVLLLILPFLAFADEPPTVPGSGRDLRVLASKLEVTPAGILRYKATLKPVEIITTAVLDCDKTGYGTYTDKITGKVTNVWVDLESETAMSEIYDVETMQPLGPVTLPCCRCNHCGIAQYYNPSWYFNQPCEFWCQWCMQVKCYKHDCYWNGECNCVLQLMNM